MLDKIQIVIWRTIREIIGGYWSDFDGTQFLDGVLLHPALADTVREKRVPALLPLLSGDGCDLPRSTEQAEFVVAEFVDVSQPAAAGKINELTLQRLLVQVSLRARRVVTSVDAEQGMCLGEVNPTESL